MFGLHILKPWNIFDGSVELLTTVLFVVVAVDAGLLAAVEPPNIDDSALALAKLNPIEEFGVDDGTVANVAVTCAAAVDGGVESAMANADAVVATGEAIDFEVISGPGCT